MKTIQEEIQNLSSEIQLSKTILTALGDSMRLYMILAMMEYDDCNGMRVVEIAEKVRLSRTAASHHIKILKNAGILKMRREGTKNYYYFDADMESLDRLINMLIHAKKIMLELPDRSGDD